MNSSSSVVRISPMLATADMDATLEFYQQVLGFSPVMHSPDYSIVQRDGLTIHFQRAADEETLQCMRKHTEIYIEVRGIREMWKHVQTFRGRFKTRDLFDRDYGMTEFHIVDPGGVLVFVGEVTAQMLS